MIQEARGFVWAFVLPGLCLSGSLAGLLNVAVFCHRRMRLANKTHIYLLLFSVVELAYLLLSLVHFAARAERFASHHGAYALVVYEKYLFNYGTTVLAFYMIFVELVVSAKRLAMVSSWRRVRFLLVLAGAWLLASLMGLPILFGLSVVRVAESPTEFNATTTTITTATFVISYAQIDARPLVKALLFMNLVFRGLLAPLLFLLINIRFIRRVNARLSTPNRKLGITRIIIGINFLVAVGNLSTTCTKFLGIMLTISSPVTVLSSIFSNVLLYASHNCSLFVFYYYSRMYRKTLRRLMKRLVWLEVNLERVSPRLAKIRL